jgi:hypothetical protein
MMQTPKAELYVYVHRRATDGRVFYVGKGKRKRAWDTGRNDYWAKVAAKHGCNIQIVDGNLSEADAFELEVALIDLCGFESLTNMTLGGEGHSGRLHTEDEKRRIGEAHKGNQYLYGHKHSAETRLKMSESQKIAAARPGMRERRSEAMKCRVITTEHRANLSAANKGKRPSEACLKAVSE